MHTVTDIGIWGTIFTLAFIAACWLGAAFGAFLGVLFDRASRRLG